MSNIEENRTGNVLEPAPAVEKYGRKQFLSDIFRCYWSELCTYTQRKFGAGPPEPEEVVQAAFERFAGLEAPHHIENPRAYLYRTTHNIAIDGYRHLSIHEKYANQELAANEEEFLDETNPERVLIARERMNIIMSVIDKMPTVQRQLVVLNRFHKVSYAEIARRTGISQTEVKRQVAQAMLECDEALERAENR